MYEKVKMMILFFQIVTKGTEELSEKLALG